LTNVRRSHDEASFSGITARPTFNLIYLRVLSKKIIMETYNAQREVLFLVDSSFVRHELYSNTSPGKHPDISAVDKFEEACWNGVLHDWLPGADQNADDKKLFLWKVLVANAFVCVQLSETPTGIKPLRSLNPYLFLSSANYN